MKHDAEHIIFDLGGVLLNIDLSLIPSGFFKIMHYDELHSKKIKNEIIPAYETGQITTKEFLNNLSPHLKSGFLEEDIIKIWNSIILEMPVTRLRMLEELRKNYKVHLLSNINDLHATCFEAYFWKWFNEDPRKYFDQYFYSHHIGKRKPDINTYLWVLDFLSADPKKVVFIDDTAENIEGARNAGINTYQLMNQKTDVIQLMNELEFLQAKK